MHNSLLASSHPDFYRRHRSSTGSAPPGAGLAGSHRRSRNSTSPRRLHQYKLSRVNCQDLAKRIS